MVRGYAADISAASASGRARCHIGRSLVVTWGADSETGVLRDVLLGPPENFRWLPTSAISKATLESGAKFDRELALGQHRELVSIYDAAGVTVPPARARPGAALPGVRPRLERR